MAESSAAEETTAAVEAAEDTEKNETDEVVIATPRDAVQGSGDAYYCWEGAYVWEALTANNGGVIDPWLAKSWEHNDDCTEWTFCPVSYTHLIELFLEKVMCKFYTLEM